MLSHGTRKGKDISHDHFRLELELPYRALIPQFGEQPPCWTVETVHACLGVDETHDLVTRRSLGIDYANFSRQEAAYHQQSSGLPLPGLMEDDETVEGGNLPSFMPEPSRQDHRPCLVADDPVRNPDQPLSRRRLLGAIRQRHSEPPRLPQ